MIIVYNRIPLYDNILSVYNYKSTMSIYDVTIHFTSYSTKYMFANFVYVYE